MLNRKKIEAMFNSVTTSKIEFYKAIGVSKTTMFNIVNGPNFPSCDTIERIADYFKVPIDYFFDREIEIEYEKPIGIMNNEYTSRRIKELEEENKSLIRENGKLEGKIELLLEQTSKAV